MSDGPVLTGLGLAALAHPLEDLVEIPLLDIPHRDDTRDRKPS